MKKIGPNIDAGIDLYIYGRKFLHYDRKEIGDVRVDMGDGKPWVPVKDWMKEGKDMTPDRLRAFAKYFYERGQEAPIVRITASDLAGNYKAIQPDDTSFPELRESEDERIRKWIANYIHHGVFNEEEHPKALKAIEWLEKQKESLHIPETCKENKFAPRVLPCSAAWFEDGEEKQKEQEPVECIEFDNEFENQVSHLLASVMNGEHEYNEGFVKYVTQSLLGYAKQEQEPVDFPTTDKEVSEFLESHPKVEVPEKYKTPDFVFSKQEYESYPIISKYTTSVKPAEWSEDYREEDIQTRFAFYTYKEDSSVLYLSNVFVEESSRNHGFGTRILKAAEKVAETIGATTISLKVKQDSYANAWYRKNGYGYVAFEDGYDWLEKNLEYMKPNKQGWSKEDEKND